MENKPKCYVNDLCNQEKFNKIVKNYELLKKQSKICADLGHFYLSNFLSDISYCENALIVVKREIESLKHYPYAFLVLTDLISELETL